MKSVRYWITAVIAVCFVPSLTAEVAQKLSDIPVTLQFPPQSAPSVIINNVSQSSDGWQIDVNFYLAFSEGAPCDVVMEYKGGLVSIWTEANGITGAVYGIYSGASYNLTWNAQVDLPFANKELYQIRFIAKCGLYVGNPVVYSSAIHIPSKSEINVISLKREIPSNCFTITYTYNESVTDYSIFWTDQFLSDETVWNNIPYADFIAEVQTVTNTTYSWTDCGDPMASVPRCEPDNGSLYNRLYYLKAN